MEKEYYVYVIYRKDNNNPFYVGKGKKWRYLVNTDRNKSYCEVRDKYGAYHKILFKNLDEEEALILEEQTILELSEFYQLTNIANGGIHGNLGTKRTEEERAKISEAVKRQWDNPVTRERLVQSRRISHSKPELKEKISKAHKGKVLTEQHKQKIRNSMSNEEVKKKMKDKKSKYYDIKIYDQENKLIAEFENSNQMLNWFKNNINPQTSLTSISSALNGKRKTYKKFKITSKIKS